MLWQSFLGSLEILIVSVAAWSIRPGEGSRTPVISGGGGVTSSIVIAIIQIHTPCMAIVKGGDIKGLFLSFQKKFMLTLDQ